MPRASLPTEMKKFRSFELCITQTKEDELWQFFENTMKEFETISDELTGKRTIFINALYDVNPYLEADFRVEVDRVSPYDWISDVDKYNSFMRKYSNIQRDLELCRRVLKWNEDEAKDSLICDWIGSIDKTLNLLKDSDEIKIVDNANYRTARESWRQKHKSFLEREKLYLEHRFCKIPDMYKEAIENENYYMKDDVRVFFNKNCSCCLKEKTFYEEQIVFEEKQHQEYLEANKKYREELRLKREEEQKRMEELHVKLPTYECSHCNYSTKSISQFDEHNESKAHIAKANIAKWYCEHCKVQARSESEHLFHLNTKKHKIAIGELEAEPESYHCEKCNYTTNLKHNWKLHLMSKKHNN